VNLSVFASPAGPWLHLLEAPPADVSNLARALERGGKLAARVLRGRKSATVPALFDEWSAALQFPLYFGDNWDAFRDCLTDLAWLPAEGYVLLIADAVHLLRAAPPAEPGRFVAVLQDAVESWNTPEKPRQPRPFHVVFHAAPGEAPALVQRWQAEGLPLSRLA
jgi:hypothetical protein